MFWLVLIGFFVVTLWMGWTFRANNSVAVDLELIWIRIPDVELWRVLLIAMAAGASFSALPIGFAWLRQRLLSHRYRRIIKRLESELHEMRSLPLAGHSSGAIGAMGATGASAALEMGAPDRIAVAEQV
jgi:uncharacterized membrane protein YciS (DUF1049 family)